MNNRLLIVDDEPDIAHFVAKVGEGCGYDVTIETEADLVFGHIADWSPTQIVLDLSMPKADGVTLLRRLAEARCTAKIVLISGFDSRVLDTARRIGVGRGLDIVEVLSKPLRLEPLRNLLRSMIPSSAVLDAQALSNAMQNGELRLAYQPKVSTATGELHGFEALLRWQHPDLGAISPTRSVALAERLGLLDHLTRWVATQAVEQLARWNERGLRFRVAINVSALNLRSPDLPDELEALCQSRQLEPGQLSLEVTETEPMSDLLEAMDILTRLRLKGFELALDDFGTGHSTLVQLHRLPFSELKIDGSFIGECAASTTAAQIVKSTVDLSRNLNLRTVAEAVEDEATLGILRTAGCEQAQGYLISRPLADAAIADWTRTWSRRDLDAPPGWIH